VGRDGLIKGERLVGELRGLIGPIWIEDLRISYIGAMVDPLPVAACRALGVEMVIAVNLNTDIIGKSRRCARLFLCRVVTTDRVGRPLAG
jgi:NTE family protein